MQTEFDFSFLINLDRILSKVLYSCTNVGNNHKLVVSGGCLRDMLFHKPISDIDVFYSDCDLKNPLLQLYFTSAKEGTTGAYPDGFEVTHTCTWLDVPVPIQLIKVKDVDKHIETFPSDMMKVKFSLEDGLTNITPGLIYDTEVKLFAWDKKVDLNYYNKIKNKYADWDHSFTTPEHNPLHNLDAIDGEF